MSDRFEVAVRSGVERRLAEVERFIPDTPSWGAATEPADLTGTVRAGTAFGQRSSTQRPGLRRLALALTVVGTLLALVAAAMLAGALRPEIDLRDGPFGPFGIYRSSDAGSSATVLPDGRVLIVSGTFQQMGEIAGRRADIWDPAGGRAATGRLSTGRVAATATLLLDGRVLVAGGFGGPYAYSSSAVASAETWNSVTGTFEKTGSMREQRVGHTATLLPDGRVLVIGGAGPTGLLGSAEVWDPTSGTFRTAGSLAAAGGWRTATLLPRGDVLAVGSMGSTAIWRSASESFERADWDLEGEVVTATALPDGRVLLIVGTQPDVTHPNPAVFISSEGRAPVYQGSLLEPRTRYAATLLADGRVAITGGVRGRSEEMASVEIWDPEAGISHMAKPLDQPVADHTALLLPDGRVLIVFNVTGPDDRTDPFVYDPGRPAIE